MNAVRSNTGSDAPVSVSPAFSPVSPGTGCPERVYTAENSRMGAPARRVERESAMSFPPKESSIVPAMGAPFHGAYSTLSGFFPARPRWAVSMP